MLLIKTIDQIAHSYGPAWYHDRVFLMLSYRINPISSYKYEFYLGGKNWLINYAGILYVDKSGLRCYSYKLANCLKNDSN